MPPAREEGVVVPEDPLPPPPVVAPLVGAVHRHQRARHQVAARPQQPLQHHPLRPVARLLRRLVLLPPHPHPHPLLPPVAAEKGKGKGKGSVLTGGARLGALMKLRTHLLADARSDERGFSLVNIVATMGLAAILMATATSNLKSLENAVADASFTTNHFLKLTRARAISRTTAIKVFPQNSQIIIAHEAETCDATTTTPTEMELRLPTGSNLTDTTWEVCFTPRGLADEHVLFTLSDDQGRTRTVEVALGGGTRIQ